jgi:hypothetical protein
MQFIHRGGGARPAARQLRKDEERTMNSSVRPENNPINGSSSIIHSNEKKN